MQSQSTFGPMRYRAFAMLIIGMLLANLGNTIQSVGAAWHLTEGGYPADIVALAQTAYNLPIMLLALPAGAWSDMYDKRKILFLSLAVMLAMSVLLAVLVEADLAGPVAIIGLTAVLACGVACIIPAVASSINFVVPRAELAAAVALNILGFNVARSFGPAVGGAITAWGGASAAFIANGAAYALVIAFWLWRLPPLAKAADQDQAEQPKRKVTAMMAEGVRFSFTSPQVRNIIVRAISFTATGAAIWAVMPLFVSQVLGEGSFVFGLLLASLGMGAVFGAASATYFRARFRAETIIRASGLIYGTGCVLVSLNPGLVPIMVLLVIAGAGWVQALSGFAVGGQLWAPFALVGRVVAMISAVTFGGLAIGSWAWGHFADANGVTTAIMVSGAGMIALTLLGLVLPMPEHRHAQEEDFNA